MYECGENISLVDTLVNIGIERLGVKDCEVTELREHLENNVGARAVIHEIQTGRKRHGIKGVPFFVIGAVDGESEVGQPYAFSGAQDPSTFQNIFGELAEKL